MTRMNDQQRELMDVLIEECSEVQKAGSKIGRHGFFAIRDAGTDTEVAYNNRADLEEEIGNVLCVIDRMINTGMVRSEEIMKAKRDHDAKLPNFSYFQPDSRLNADEAAKQLAAYTEKSS